MDRNKSVDKAISDHKVWVETNGLSGEQLDLSGDFLSKANFSNTNLEGANFLGASIVEARISRSSLIEAGILQQSALVRKSPYRKSILNGSDTSKEKSR